MTVRAQRLPGGFKNKCMFVHFNMCLLVLVSFFFLIIFYLYLEFPMVTLKRMVTSSAIRLIKCIGVNRPVSVDFKLWIVQERVKPSPI